MKTKLNFILFKEIYVKNYRYIEWEKIGKRYKRLDFIGIYKTQQQNNIYRM